MSIQQKNSRKVAFQFDEGQDQHNHITDQILDMLRCHGIVISDEFSKGIQCSDELSEESLVIRSCKSFKRETFYALTSLQKLLIKELVNSLSVIIDQIFDQQQQYQSHENGIKSVMIFYGLLKTQCIKNCNSSQILRWIYDICNISTLPLELCNVVASIKKKLVKLGFILLKRQRENGQLQRFDIQNEQEFKIAVSHLIEQKEKMIEQLQYQLCRICQTYILTNNIQLHLDQCEYKHQKQYYESKIQDKSKAIVEYMNELETSSEEKYDLKVFHDRIYKVMGDNPAMFVLKNNLQELQAVVRQYKQSYYSIEVYAQTVQLLQSYLQIITKNNAYDQNLSEKDSKFQSKSKIFTSEKSGSITSFFHSSQPTENCIISEKTIKSESDFVCRSNACKISGIIRHIQIFQVIESIGRGSYSEVYLVRKKNTKDLYAMKVIQITDLNQERIKAFKKEQKIYKSINGGFNVKLYYSFCQSNLYFLILDYGCGGDLRSLLQKQIYLQEQYAKIYIANLILAVSSIHQMGIVHRDLKPENIVINQLGELILTDFNLSKLIKDFQIDKPNTFYGTPDYIAPQVLREQLTNQAIDWFSVGVIAYEMVIGATPFAGTSPQEVFDNILKGQIQWPEVGYEQGQISPQCKSLIEGLLNCDPHRRLGANSLSQLQSHQFFSGLNWQKMQQSDYFFVPAVASHYEQNLALLQQIESKKRECSIKFIRSDTVIRYDILKSKTNKNVRSHRNSRFKLQKELQALRIIPSNHSVKVKKYNSNSNFTKQFEDSSRISCKELLPSQQSKSKLLN